MNHFYLSGLFQTLLPTTSSAVFVKLLGGATGKDAGISGNA